MWQSIGAALSLIFLIIKNLFEKDAIVRKQNDDLHKEAKDAILSRNPSRVTSVFDKLRR